MWTCCPPRAPIMPEGHSLEWGLWNGPICVMELDKRWVRIGYNLVPIWRVLQASIQWGVSQVWLVNKLLPGVKKCGWMVQLCTSQRQCSKLPTWNCKDLAQGHILVLWFFLRDKEFVSKTINEGSVDLDKFPASKVCQLAKKYGSSKATARHIKQVAGEMQPTQIPLMRHQCTELSNGKYKKQKPQAKPRPIQNKNAEQKQSSYHKKSFDPRNAHKQKDRCSKCGDSTHLEGFTCHAKKY